MMKKSRKALLAIASAILGASLAAAPAWSATTFQDVLVQAPTLGAPQRGSLAGTLSRVAFGPGDLARGAFALPLPIDTPSDRGPLLAKVTPRYSPETGIGEWGAGWQTDLSIRRFRPSGELDFATDDFTSPWGRLVAGQDGYYPAGLTSVVRVTASNGGWLAVTSGGTRFTFAAGDAITTSRGTYEWVLSRVDDLFGDSTTLQWTRSAGGRPVLAAVLWGGRGDGTQYKMTFEHEAVATPFVSYASGDKQVTDQRVSRVTVAVKQGAGYATRSSYALDYQASPTGPAFYLHRVTKTYASGQSEPPVVYDYDLGTEQLATATLAHVASLDAFLGTSGGLMIEPDHAAITDLEQDGLADLETGFDQTTVRQTATGYVIEALPPATNANTLCRPDASLFNKPRNLARMHPDAVEPQVVFTHQTPTGGMAHVLVCDRQGVPLYDQNIAGSWTLGPNTRLVDVDSDKQPDLVRVANGQIQVLKNTSTSPQAISFAEAATTTALSPRITPVASWILDFNGDGRPDVMVRHTAGVEVWLGMGSGQFEPVGRTYGFKTPAGAPLPNFASYQFSFGDFNGDGLSDVILTQGRIVLVFTNRGDSLVQTPVPALASIPWTFSYPVVADLSGGGNEEAVFLNGNQAMAIELTTPSTGLLRSADDGKGTVLRFGYGRAHPAPGIIRRPAILLGLTVESSGYDTVTYGYDYDAPVMHTVGKNLVGFGSVTKRSPSLTEHVTLLNDDDISGVHSRSDDTDDRTPGVIRFASDQYDDVQFHGVRWLRPASTEHGYRSAGGGATLSTTTQHTLYERDLCPTVTTQTGPSGQLVRATTLTTVTALPPDLQCVAGSQSLLGSHADAALDFNYLVDLARNDLGQVTRITQFGANMATLVLQDVAYGADHRIASVTVPGRGTSTVSYDAAGRMTTLTDPLGMTTQAEAYEPVSDALLELHTARPNAATSVFFAYDGRERLQASWDDVSGGSSDHPLASYAYQEATSTSPGRIDTQTLADAVTWTSRRAVSIVAADGEPLLAGTWLGDHFSLGSASVSFRNTLTQRSSFVGILTDAALAAMTSADLRAFGTPLAETVHAGFGHQIQATTIQQVNVVGTTTTELVLGPTELVTRVHQPGGFVAESAMDAAGMLVRKLDENGVSHRYTYDVLGRLVHLDTPDGGHTLAFDSFGRPARVTRDGIGAVTYAYDATTGLQIHTQHLDAAGAVIDTSDTQYDATGRPIQVAQNATDDAAELTLDYDGRLGASTATGQLGRLTRVCGDDWERTALFDPLGRAYQEHVTLSGWRDLTCDKTYRADGSVASDTLTIRDAAGATKLTTTTDTTLDSLGRVSTFEVDGAVLYTLSYDGEGRLARADFTSGEAITFDYDPTTHQRRGHALQSPLSTGGVAWERDQRGLIAAETYANGTTTTRRQYGYDGRGALLSAAGGADTASYTYTASGLPDSINDIAGTRSVHHVSAHLTVGDVVYTWDAAGRVNGKGDWTFRYGANGQLAHASRAGRQLDFVYDDSNHRLLKRSDGVPVRADVAGGVLTEDHFVELVSVGGVVAGVLDNGQFTALLTDPRGTPFAGPDGAANLATAYGVRAAHLAISEVLDYARLGWDPDLDLVRMGVRDYDPKLSQFLTPDPLYFADLDKCQSSPLQCTLYGYAGGNPLSFVDPTGQENAATLVLGAQQALAFAEGLTIARTLAVEGGAAGAVAGGLILVGYAYYQYSLISPNPLPAGHGEFGPTIAETLMWADRQQAFDAAAASNLQVAEDFKALASSIKNNADKAGAKATATQAATSPGGMDPRDRPPKNTPPPNKSPVGAGRRGALNEAKRQNNILTSQHPERTLPNVDRNNNPQPGRQYVFRDQDGKKVILRDDAAGHDYGPGDPQNRGPHINDPAGNHYDY